MIDEKRCIGESNMSVLSQSACIVHVVCPSMHTKSCTKQSKRFEGERPYFIEFCIILQIKGCSKNKTICQYPNENHPRGDLTLSK